MGLFESLADPSRKYTFEIQGLHKMLLLKKYRTQRNMVEEAVRKGKSTRGSFKTENSRNWTALRELLGFSIVEPQEMKLSPDGLAIAEHLQQIENIISIRQRHASARINIHSPSSLLAQFVLPKLGTFVRHYNAIPYPNPIPPEKTERTEVFCFDRGTKATWFALRDDFADIILIRSSFLRDLSTGEKKLLFMKDLGVETYAWVLPAGKTKTHLLNGEIPMVRIGGQDGEINKTLKQRAPKIDWRLNVSDFSGVLNMLEADSSFGGLLPEPMANAFVVGRKRSNHLLLPCSEYPKAAISLACKKSAYASQPKVRDLFNTIAR